VFLAKNKLKDLHSVALRKVNLYLLTITSIIPSF